VPCECKNTKIVTDSNKIMDMEKEVLIQLQIDVFKWRTLYKCSFCNALWEETETEDRFIGRPQLTQVSNDYAIKEWGKGVFEI